MSSPFPVPPVAGAIAGLSTFLLSNAQGLAPGVGLPFSAIVGLIVYYFAFVVTQAPTVQPIEAAKPKKKTKQEKKKPASTSSSSSASSAASDEESEPAPAASSSSKKKDKKAKKAAAAAAAAVAEAEGNESETSEASETSEGDDEEEGSSLSKNAKKKAKKKAKEAAAKKEEEKKAAAAAAAAAAKKAPAKKEEKKQVAAAPAPTPAPAPAKKDKKIKEAAPLSPSPALAAPQEEEAFQQSKSDKKKNKKDEKAKKREEEAKHTKPTETPKSPAPISPAPAKESKKDNKAAAAAAAVAAVPTALSPQPAEFEEGEWNIAKAAKPTSAQKKEIKAAESKSNESSSSSAALEPSDYVDIPVSKIPAIIGKMGAVLKALQEGTGANIEVPKAAERDLSTLTARILIRGEPEQVKYAKICVKSLAEKGFSAVTHPGFVSDDIFVESRQHGLIIGSKGSTLKTIQTKTGTIIKMPEKGGNDRILIVGPKDGVKAAKDAIKQLVADGFSSLTHEGHEKKEIDFPAAKLGLLIGPGGQTIKSIQGDTEATIKIPARDAENQKVVVFGTAAAVAKAEKQILKILEPKVKKSNKDEEGKDDADDAAGGEASGSAEATNGDGAAPQSAFDAWAATEVQQTNEDAMWGATQ